MKTDSHPELATFTLLNPDFHAMIDQDPKTVISEKVDEKKADSAGK